MAVIEFPRRPITSPQPASSRAGRTSARLGFWPLVIATFFMVSGGAYGTEDIVQGAGYGRAILILLLTPIVWSLPTALMLGELSSALPAEGGFYAWVRRAMGNFWGFQEAWLSLVASIFDMAIYPTLFVAYLTRLFPWFAVNNRGLMVGLAVVIVCAALNIAGIRVVATTSVWLFLLLSAPFAAIVVLAPFKYGALANAVTTPTTVACRHHGRTVDRHVELHGMGQRLHHRGRSEAARSALIPAPCSRPCAGVAHLHPAGGRHVPDQAESRQRGRPDRGPKLRACSAARCCALLSWPAA